MTIDIEVVRVLRHIPGDDLSGIENVPGAYVITVNSGNASR